MSDGSVLKPIGLCVVVSSLVVGLVAGIGYVSTSRLANGEGVAAMLAGCGVSFVASCLGSIPIALALAGPDSNRATAILASTALRFLTVLVLVVPLVFSGWLNQKVFVLWVAVSYLVLLLVDTALAVRLLGRESKNET